MFPRLFYQSPFRVVRAGDPEFNANTMRETGLLDGAVTSLESSDTRNLLDVVDNLRSQGISRYIDLPEIIVCGEQSCGKSSVLEAISGVKFPSKDNLCTRFATELMLRRGPVAPIKISIVPGSREERSDAEMKKLKEFKVSVSEAELNLEKFVESAKAAMGINDTTKVFSSDILRIEVSGPEQPHLTLVDLPGLFEAGSRSQSDADSDTVKALVLGYMKSPRSIILAVVSAKSEFNNQIITRYAREIDPQGMRTLGLITKPDKLDEGSESERFFVELAQNKDVKFRLGWHVLRNRDHSTKNTSLQDRNQAEEHFFSSGIWSSLLPSQVGVHALKPRLSKILKDQIIAQLPDVLAQIQDGIQGCTNKLAALGAPRVTAQEQRRHLLVVSQSFSSLMKDAIDGVYSDPFFEEPSSDKGYRKRLRAVLQNALTQFAANMRKHGHTYNLVDLVSAESNDKAPSKAALKSFPTVPQRITRKEYISRVKILIERSRGKELPGTYNPLIIGHLFREQHQPWGKLINDTMKKIIDAVSHVVYAVLLHVSDPFTQSGLSKQVITPKLEGLKAHLLDKVRELTQPYETGHPMTYNHYLTENVQKAQRERRMQDIRKSVEKFFGDCPTIDKATLTFNINSLIKVLVDQTEADMTTYASSNATDFMEAYYKVALKTIIDDVSVLAVEACLIEKLPRLFCPEHVLDLDDEMVCALAAEDAGSSAERARCNEKLRVLNLGLRELKTVQECSIAHPTEKGHPEYAASGSSELYQDCSDEVSSTESLVLDDGPSEKLLATPCDTALESVLSQLPVTSCNTTSSVLETGTKRHPPLDPQMPEDTTVATGAPLTQPVRKPKKKKKATADNITT